MTPKEQKKGLMFRKSMPLHKGMLFVLNKPRPASIWMKNTFIPLDIIWLDQNLSILKIIKNATPLSKKIYTCYKNTSFILEINAGISENLDIKIGDKLKFN